MNKITILLLLLMAPVFTMGQERLVDQGNREYENYSFSTAQDIYQHVLDKGYSSADLL